VGDDTFDLIVIGAGINGSGIARDAALRGLRVLLLDKGDIANGTTAWATRLIHGGLRYLEHREIGLVRESLRERERLLRLAPHLVRPLPLVIPVYRGDRRGRPLIQAGMLAYDVLSFDKSLPRHRVLRRAGALRREPGLNPDGLLGAAVYYDAQVEYAERLAVENALDARDHGATIRTYHRVDRILSDDDQVSGVSGHDALTGEAFVARSPVVINVAGPWVDAVLAGAPGGGSQRLIGGTKGSHIVVGPFPGAPHDALYVEARRDGRPFFIVPWNDAYLIGTTDVRYDGDLDEVVAEAWEIDLLLEETNRVIPSARLTRDDVRYSYAGVRPLPHVPNGTEGAITRRHIVRDHGREGGPRGLFSVVGGKLTTYRELAEQAVALALRALGRPETASRTIEISLPGGRAAGGWEAFREAFLRDSPLPRASSEHLLRVYGAQAEHVLAMATTPDLREIVDPFTGAIAAEIPWAFEVEAAQTLTDALARRTMIGLGPDVGVGVDRAVAEVARRTLGWSPARASDEVEAYRRWIRRYRPRSLEAATASA
jgi:glycerol-3-phosphate dehydrogenase